MATWPRPTLASLEARRSELWITISGLEGRPIRRVSGRRSGVVRNYSVLAESSGCELIRCDDDVAVAGGIRSNRSWSNPLGICFKQSSPSLALSSSLASSAMRSRAQLAAENLFLRKQLALYQERKVKPRRADDATRFILAALSRFLAWRQLLVDREAGDADPLASTGIPTVLALEVTDARSACDFTGRAAADRDDGGGESDVGRRTHRQRAPAEAWHSAVAAYGAAIHAVTPAASEERDASMEHLRAEPRPVGPRE